jgi:hypothetical protein
VQRGERHDARIIHKNVDGPEFLFAKVGKRFRILKISYVEGAALCSAAGLADFGNDFLEAIGATSAQEHFRAFAHEKACSGLADAAAGSGDEYDFNGDIHTMRRVTFCLLCRGSWRA